MGFSFQGVGDNIGFGKHFVKSVRAGVDLFEKGIRLAGPAVSQHGAVESAAELRNALAYTARPETCNGFAVKQIDGYGFGTP